jgi:DNA polymerase-3 subunit beta
MEIIVGKEELSKALHLLNGVIEQKKTLPILANFLIEAGENKALLAGTDLEVGIKKTIPVTVKKPGGTTLSARRLYEIVRELPEAQVSIKVSESDVTTLECGRAEFKIKGTAKEEFPALPKAEGKEQLSINQKVLAQMVKKTAFATSSDETRYTLTGILFQVKEDFLKLVATDGHRLAVIKKKIEAKGLEKEIILPKKALLEVVKLDDGQEENIKIFLLENQALFERGEAMLFSRIIEGQFPDYTGVIPKETPRKIILKRDEFMGALRRTSTMMSERSIPTKLVLSKGKFTVLCINPDLGEAKEELEIKPPQEDLTIGFNARYLIDALNVIEQENVELALNDAVSPATLRGEGDEDYLCVVMPMRI